MIVKRSIQATVIKAALFILFALLIGKYAFIPNMRYIPKNLLAFISGAMILGLLFRIKDVITGARTNALAVEKVRVCFPKNEDELKQIGVKSELDFAYAMMQVFEYMKAPVWTNTIREPEQYYNKALFDKSVRMFEKMFGRMPSGAWALDWAYISMVETSLALKLDLHRVPYKTFLRNVSDEVKKYYEELQYTKAA